MWNRIQCLAPFSACLRSSLTLPQLVLPASWACAISFSLSPSPLPPSINHSNNKIFFKRAVNFWEIIYKHLLYTKIWQRNLYIVRINNFCMKLNKDWSPYAGSLFNFQKALFKYSWLPLLDLGLWEGCAPSQLHNNIKEVSRVLCKPGAKWNLCLGSAVLIFPHCFAWTLQHSAPTSAH